MPLWTNFGKVASLKQRSIICQFESDQGHHRISTCMNKETFCVIPFLGGAIGPTGKTMACCQTFDSSPYDYKQVVQWFTSDEMSNFRQDLYNGVKHSWCKRCWDVQDIGQPSLREFYNKELVNKETAQIIRTTVNNNFRTEQIYFLDIKPGNLCNLKCVMCWPDSSSRVLAEWRQNRQWFPTVSQFDGVDFSWPETEQFKEIVTQLAPHLKYVKITGGEPFLNPYIEDILEALPEDCLVHIITNLTIIDDRKISLLKKFKKLWLAASVDAVEELYEIIRYPSSWDNVKANIEKIQKVLPVENFTFAITVTPLSILQIDKTLNTLKGNKLLSLVDIPRKMTLNAIPEELMEDIRSRINNIHDSKLKEHVLRMLSKRQFDEEYSQECKKFLSRISSIRNIDIDMQYLVKN